MQEQRTATDEQRALVRQLTAGLSDGLVDLQKSSAAFLSAYDAGESASPVQSQRQLALYATFLRETIVLLQSQVDEALKTSQKISSVRHQENAANETSCSNSSHNRRWKLSFVPIGSDDNRQTKGVT